MCSDTIWYDDFDCKVFALWWLLVWVFINIYITLLTHSLKSFHIRNKKALPHSLHPLSKETLKFKTKKKKHNLQNKSWLTNLVIVFISFSLPAWIYTIYKFKKPRKQDIKQIRKFLWCFPLQNYNKINQQCIGKSQ